MVRMFIDGDDGVHIVIFDRLVSGIREPVLLLGSDYIEGWYSSPDLKVDSTDRQTGHGSFAHVSEDVLYATRTVTAHVTCIGMGRAATVRKAAELSRSLCQMVTVTVDDGETMTTVRGYCRLTFDSKWAAAGMTGTLDVVCDDPRRYGPLQTGELLPLSASVGDLEGQGLQFAGGKALRFPLTFADYESAEGGNHPSTLTLTNAGNARAYPVFEVQGLSAVTITDHGTGLELAYPAWTDYGNPLTLDCLSRTASIAGVDVTRRLTRRNFPTIPAEGSTTLSLQAQGTGQVAVRWHDTYI